MLRLKEISCVHDIREGKDGIPMTLTAHFHGVAAGTGCSLRVMFSPDSNQEAAWLTLERLIQRTARDIMKPGVHDVEEFYQDDPTEGCTCGASIGCPAWVHSRDCPLYQSAQEEPVREE